MHKAIEFVRGGHWVQGSFLVMLLLHENTRETNETIAVGHQFEGDTLVHNARHEQAVS